MPYAVIEKAVIK